MNLIPRDSLLNFDNFFENYFGPNRGLAENSEGFFTPRVDIKETQKHYEVSAELPGVSKDDLTVTLENGYLTIEAETHQESKQEEEGQVVRQERRYGKFMRSFSLDSDINEKDIKASFKDGILTMEVPKVESAQPKTHRVEIH